MSLAFPSPGHQLTIFGGGGAHVCARALLVASGRTAALTSKQDANAVLALLGVTPLVFMCSLLFFSRISVRRSLENFSDPKILGHCSQAGCVSEPFVHG